MTEVNAPEKLERHPLSKVWGDMSPKEFEELVEDVRKHGVREPVKVFEGMVLDGWHRYTAAVVAEKECRLEHYTGDDPRAYVVSENLHRRHLTPGERADRVNEVYDTPLTGSNQYTDGEDAPDGAPIKTQAEKAKLAGVGRRTIQRLDRKLKAKRGEVEPAKPKAKAKATPQERLVALRADVKGLKAERRKDAKALKDLTAENASLKEQTATLQNAVDLKPPPDFATAKAEASADPLGGTRAVLAYLDNAHALASVLVKQWSSTRLQRVPGRIRAITETIYDQRRWTGGTS